MATKSILERGFKTEAEKLSESYREKLGISKFSALDAFNLAKYLHVPIFSVAEAFEGCEDNPCFSLMNDASRFSAMWMPNEDGDKIIIHNTNHSSARQQSNLMHELAHIIRGHTIPPEQAKLCILLNLHYFNPLHEQEAKYLGACLQITRPGLQWALKNNYSHQQISEYYNASIEMVKFRINATGVERQRYFMSLKAK